MWLFAGKRIADPWTETARVRKTAAAPRKARPGCRWRVALACDDVVDQRRKRRRRRVPLSRRAQHHETRDLGRCCEGFEGQAGINWAGGSGGSARVRILVPSGSIRVQARSSHNLRWSAARRINKSAERARARALRRAANSTKKKTITTKSSAAPARVPRWRCRQPAHSSVHCFRAFAHGERSHRQSESGSVTPCR